MGFSEGGEIFFKDLTKIADLKNCKQILLKNDIN